MPTYRVTDPETNRTLRLTGDSPPTEQELIDIFARVGSSPVRQTAAPAAPPVPQNKRPGQDVARTIAPYARPVLEYGGALGGAILGGAAGAFGLNPASVAAAGALGGGLGYAGGRHAANALEEYAGEREPPTLKNALVQTGEDIGTGAAMEMTGQVLGPAVNMLTQPAKNLGKKVAVGLYEHALKPPPSVEKWIRDRAVKQGLEGEYSLTDKGFQKLSDKLTKVNEWIDDYVRSAPQYNEVTKQVVPSGTYRPRVVPSQVGGGNSFLVTTGKREFLSPDGKSVPNKIFAQYYKNIEDAQKAAAGYLDTFKVDKIVKQKPIEMSDIIKSADRLKSWYRKLPHDEAQPYIDAISDIQTKYMSEPTLTPARAQEMKKAIYQLLKGKYGEMKGVDVETRKAIAHGLKEELLDRIPQLKGLNAMDSDLINLNKLMERALNRIGNHELINIGDMIVAGGTSATTGSLGVGGLTGVFYKVLKSPSIQSRIAILVNKASKATAKQGLLRHKVPAYMGQNIMRRDNAGKNILEIDPVEKEGWSGNNGD